MTMGPASMDQSAEHVIRNSDDLVEAPQIIATIDAKTGYDGLIVALRARVAEIGLNQRLIDELSGLTPGLTGKLLGAACPTKFGFSSLLPILATLGLRFGVMVDPQQEALMRPHWEPGQAMQRRPFREAPLGESSITRLTPRIAAEMGRKGRKRQSEASARLAASKGGKARRKWPKKMRQESARKAALARWAKRNTRRDILILTGEMRP
jgi:hypothetical protein